MNSVLVLPVRWNYGSVPPGTDISSSPFYFISATWKGGKYIQYSKIGVTVNTIVNYLKRHNIDFNQSWKQINHDNIQNMISWYYGAIIEFVSIIVRFTANKVLMEGANYE